MSNIAKGGYTAASTALANQDRNSPAALIKSHQAFLQQRLDKLGAWVTAGVRPEALIRFTLLDLQNSEALRRCTPTSVYLALLGCAQTGLEPGALRQEAFLVPFKGVATFMPGWRGLVKMAKRSREVLNITANVVREADEFDLDLGTTPTLRHKPLLRGDRGEVIGAYAYASLAHGLPEIEWMDLEDLKAIETAGTKGGKVSPAYANWRDQMQRKAPIRRLCKRLPLGPDYYVAMALEQAGDTDNPSKSMIDIIDTVTDGEASRADDASNRTASMAAQANKAEATTTAGDEDIDPDTWTPPYEGPQ